MPSFVYPGAKLRPEIRKQFWFIQMVISDPDACLLSHGQNLSLSLPKFGLSRYCVTLYKGPVTINFKSSD